MEVNVALEVKGMSCSHCEKAIKDTVTNLNGVNGVEVHVKNDEVKVDYNDDVVTLEEICDAIEEQGYDVVR